MECLDLFDPGTEYRVAGELARRYHVEDAEVLRADARLIIQELWTSGAFVHGCEPPPARR